ncbi:hypothetical protein KUTeg_023713 [Tegillarca granosa]|uniref:SAM domain-containing protein n=1 Tax=Tegillarca granosa TaxID=220873 RepID=A0ABQ9E8L7_TEGGR|nr:hypothetical protein KUTeg_023713 [Tegillarca granosa]
MLKGSAQGGSRKVVSQICENVAFRHSRAAKRKSLPITGLTFDPVMEREEEINPAKILDAVETLIPMPEIKSSKTHEEQHLDYGEEWDKIADIISSYGEDISKYYDFSAIESEIEKIFSSDPDNPPENVEQWLNSLHLSQYLDTFISHKCDSMDRVLQLWELELNNVLHISALGHRKRILVSLSHRKPPDRQYPSLGKMIRDSTIHLRPPHHAQTDTPVKQWRHRPEMLIKGCCNYTAHVRINI